MGPQTDNTLKNLTSSYPAIILSAGGNMKNITNGALVRILEDLKLDDIVILNKGTEDLVIAVRDNQASLKSLEDSDIPVTTDISNLALVERTNVLYVDFKKRQVR